MATSPSTVRAGLQAVTEAAQADLRAVAQSAGESEPAEVRAALFAATPLLVAEYGDGASELALGWFEEIREEASPPSSFTPTPIVNVPETLADSVAWATTPLYDLALERLTQQMLDQAVAESLTLLEPIVQHDVAAGFWDTITGNTEADPEAVGWQRFTRPGACKFCLMLADRGAVYTEATARFAAHTSCHCVVGPSYDPDAPKASVEQYVASRRQRTEKERADLRRYLNRQFPDAPG